MLKTQSLLQTGAVTVGAFAGPILVDLLRQRTSGNSQRNSNESSTIIDTLKRILYGKTDDNNMKR